METLSPPVPVKCVIDGLFTNIAEKLSHSGHKKSQIVVCGSTAEVFYGVKKFPNDIDCYYPSEICNIVQSNNCFACDMYNIRLCIDTNYNPFMCLIHPDFMDNLIFYKNFNTVIDVSILSPVDLIISKMCRFDESTINDISYIKEKYNIDKYDLERKLLESLDYYVGNIFYIEQNIIELIRRLT